MTAVSGNQPVTIKPISNKQQASHNTALGNKAGNFSKGNIPEPENKIPGPDINVTSRANHKESPPLSERVIRIIDHGLMGWGKMTHLNFGRTAYRVLEECLTTAVQNHGTTMNHGAAAITGAVGSAWVKGINPASLQNIATTSLHHAPRMAAAVTGEKSTNMNVAKIISDFSNVAVIVSSLYPAITSGNLDYATGVLVSLLASYGAHSQVHHHLHQLCNHLAKEYQLFLEPWLQAFAQVGVTAGMPGNPAKAADQYPAIDTETVNSLPRLQDDHSNRRLNNSTLISQNRNATETAKACFPGDTATCSAAVEQTVPFSIQPFSSEPEPARPGPAEPNSRRDQSAGTASRGWSCFQAPVAMAAEIRHYLWQEVRAYMDGNTGAACSNSNNRCPKPDSHNVTTFPKTKTAGWLVAGPPETQKQLAECLRYQSCAPDVRKLSDSPFISISESGDFVPAMGVVQCVRSLNSTGNSTTQHYSPIEQRVGQAFNGTAGNNPANFTCREPVTSSTLNAMTMPVTPTNLILAITFCEQKKDSKIYLFTYDTETKTMAIDIGSMGFTPYDQKHDQGDPMDILTRRIRDAANINVSRNDSNELEKDGLKGNLRQKCQPIGSPYSNSSTVRFSPGNSTVSGTVEVFYSGEWGYIYPDGFSNIEAGIICRQMGYPADHAMVINDNDSLNSTDTHLNTIMNDVHCRGSEKNIQDCQHKGPDEQNCHLNDNKAVAVRCQPVGMSLITVSRTGIIDFIPTLFLNGTWAYFIPDSIDNNERSVICHELGFGRSAVPSRFYASSSSPNRVQGTFQCTGKEESLLDCPGTELTLNKSYNQEHCISMACPIQVDLRLRECQTTAPVKNGMAGCPEARIIYREWGIINNFTPSSDHEARVLCYALGHPGDGARFVKAQYYDNRKTATYSISLIHCNGSEKDITSCELILRDDLDLPSAENMQAINCPPVVQVSNECGEGPDNQFLVMWYRNRWQFIEGNGFDNNAASVVCSEMGYSGQGAIALQQNLSFPVVGFLSWQHLRCLGNETHFLDCERIGPQVHNGMNISAITVICENQRLNNTVTGATCQDTTTPAPSTIQSGSPIRTEAPIQTEAPIRTKAPIRTETPIPHSMPNDNNAEIYCGIAICSLAGLVVLACSPCCLNSRKLRAHDHHSSPCQLPVNTISTTCRTPLYFCDRYVHRTESTDRLYTDDDSEHQPPMATAV